MVQWKKYDVMLKERLRKRQQSTREEGRDCQTVTDQTLHREQPNPSQEEKKRKHKRGKRKKSFVSKT